MSQLAPILNAIAWPIVVLIVLSAFYCPIKRVLSRVLQVRAGSKGIELVLEELLMGAPYRLHSPSYAMSSAKPGRGLRVSSINRSR